MKLGKKEYKSDERTPLMAKFFAPDITPPLRYDFDKHRKPVPIHMWGNDVYGDCVFAAGMNGLMRNERVEQHKTLKATDEDVIMTYQALTGCRAPDDANDQGYVMLDFNNWWRHDGWTLRANSQHQFKIAAFGELEPNDREQLRLGCYLLRGIYFGIALPRTAQQQTNEGVWDVSSGPGSEPGSWGGHAVYAKRYDRDSFHVLTWGREIQVTNEFIEKYSDETWCVVDDLDNWRKTHGVNVDQLEKYLAQIGAKQQ